MGHGRQARAGQPFLSIRTIRWAFCYPEYTRTPAQSVRTIGTYVLYLLLLVE